MKLEKEIVKQDTIVSKAKKEKVKDSIVGNIGWGIIGFFFTIIGISLSFILRDYNRADAREALKGTIAGVVFKALVALITLIIIFVIK